LPPRLAIAQSFATVDSRSPDLRTLSLLPPGTGIVSTQAIPGVLRLSQLPPLSSWDMAAGGLSVNLTEPLGWQYKFGMLNVGQPSRLVDPLEHPDALSPFVAVAMAGQAGMPRTLSVQLSLGLSLITDGEFLDGAWQSAVGDCNAAGRIPAGSLGAELIRDGPHGDPALRLSASAHSACESRDIAWIGGALLIHLWIRHVSGASPRLCVFEAGPGRCAPTSIESRGAGWADYAISVTPDAGTRSLGLFIYADGDASGVRTVNDYADIAVHSVPSTDLVLLGYPDGATSVATPQLLVLRETYSGNWIGPTRSIHVLVDGILNGWLLGQGGSGLSATYAPSELVSLGLWVSGGALAVLLVLALNLPLKHLRAGARRC
jgi:arabinofuranan 3-O-arabinosyltransferase